MPSESDEKLSRKDGEEKPMRDGLPLPAKRKTRAAKKYDPTVIFPDTKTPATRSEFIAMYVTGDDLRLGTLAEYRELAEQTLRDVGFEYGDQASFDRLSAASADGTTYAYDRYEDFTFPTEVYESWLLITIYDRVKTGNECHDLLSEILRLARQGGVSYGQEDFSLIEYLQEEAGRVKALGERIKGRIEGEEKARLGKAYMEDLAAGIRATSEEADRNGRAAWKVCLRVLIEYFQKHREPPKKWSDSQIAKWAKEHGAEYAKDHKLEPLPPRSERSLRRYLSAIRREEISATPSNI